MMAAYTQNGYDKEALELFDQMQQKGVAPDETTIIVALTTCRNTTSLTQGKQIHDMIKRKKIISTKYQLT